MANFRGQKIGNAKGFTVSDVRPDLQKLYTYFQKVLEDQLVPSSDGSPDIPVRLMETSALVVKARITVIAECLQKDAV